MMNFIHFITHRKAEQNHWGLFSHSCCCPLVGNYVRNQMRVTVWQCRTLCIEMMPSHMEETANTYFHWITFCDLHWNDAAWGEQESSTICSLFLLQWDFILQISVLQAKKLRKRIWELIHAQRHMHAHSSVLIGFTVSIMLNKNTSVFTTWLNDLFNADSNSVSRGSTPLSGSTRRVISTQ